MPLHKIKIDLTNFQNRHTAYSIDTVYGILDAIVRGEFIKELMNPIILRKNKEGDDYILAGHSRKEFAMWLDALYKNDISSLSQEAQKELNGWCRMSGYDIISLCQTAKNRCDANNYY